MTWAETEVAVESTAAVSVIVQGRGSAARAVHGISMTRTVVPLGRVSGSDWIRDHAEGCGGTAGLAEPLLAR